MRFQAMMMVRIAIALPQKLKIMRRLGYAVRCEAVALPRRLRQDGDPGLRPNTSRLDFTDPE